jgi:hypothetical protein
LELWNWTSGFLYTAAQIYPIIILFGCLHLTCPLHPASVERSLALLRESGACLRSFKAEFGGLRHDAVEEVAYIKISYTPRTTFPLDQLIPPPAKQFGFTIQLIIQSFDTN